MMDQILMQFCDKKRNAWPYIVKQDHAGQDKDQNQYQKAPRPTERQSLTRLQNSVR